MEARWKGEVSDTGKAAEVHCTRKYTHTSNMCLFWKFLPGSLLPLFVHFSCVIVDMAVCCRRLHCKFSCLTWFAILVTKAGIFQLEFSLLHCFTALAVTYWRAEVGPIIDFVAERGDVCRWLNQSFFLGVGLRAPLRVYYRGSLGVRFILLILIILTSSSVSSASHPHPAGHPHSHQHALWCCITSGVRDLWDFSGVGGLVFGC